MTVLDRFVDRDAYLKKARPSPLKVVFNDRWDLNAKQEPSYAACRELQACITVRYSYLVSDKDEVTDRLRAHAREGAEQVIVRELFNDAFRELAILRHAINENDWEAAMQATFSLEGALKGKTE